MKYGNPVGNYGIRTALLLLAIGLACANPGTEPEDSAAPVASIPAGPYVPGQSYLGRNGYIEYVAGNAPIIISAPHGGALTPDQIPDRTGERCGGSATTATDRNTVELAKSIQQRYHARFGRYPHVIVAHLARRKLDANRTPPEAACGNTDAEIALAEWHLFIDAAKKATLQSAGRGWYIDLHGHGHGIQRLELGYLLTSAQLNLPDASLNASSVLEEVSSIRTMSQSDPASFADQLRGPRSLGSLYARNGFPAVPSSADPRPVSAPYFSGGDNTRRHTCGDEARLLGGVTGGNICGVQIEANYDGVRDTPENRARFGDATSIVLEEYLRERWGLELGPAR